MRVSVDIFSDPRVHNPEFRIRIRKANFNYGFGRVRILHWHFVAYEKKICFQVGTGSVIIKICKIWNLFLNFLQIFKIVRIWIRIGDSEFTDSDLKGQYPDPQHWPEGAVPTVQDVISPVPAWGGAWGGTACACGASRRTWPSTWRTGTPAHTQTAHACAATYIFSVIHALSKLRSPIWATCLRIFLLNAGMLDHKNKNHKVFVYLCTERQIFFLV
jgi:hypothetical protein